MSKWKDIRCDFFNESGHYDYERKLEVKEI